MSKFWWGYKEDTSKIAWMNWKRMGKNQENGGLGYRDLEVFNIALLAKQGWRLVNEPETLVARVFKEKYFPRGDFMHSNLGWRPSFAWRSIWNAKSLVEEGILWKVGNGEKVRIWDDRWIPNTQTHMVQSPISMLDNEAKVSDLINREVNWWNVPLVESLFPKPTVAKICNIGILLFPHDLRWIG